MWNDHVVCFSLISCQMSTIETSKIQTVQLNRLRMLQLENISGGGWGGVVGGGGICYVTFPAVSFSSSVSVAP